MPPKRWGGMKVVASAKTRVGAAQAVSSTSTDSVWGRVQEEDKAKQAVPESTVTLGAPEPGERRRFPEWLRQLLGIKRRSGTEQFIRQTVQEEPPHSERYTSASVFNNLGPDEVPVAEMEDHGGVLRQNEGVEQIEDPAGVEDSGARMGDNGSALHTCAQIELPFIERDNPAPVFTSSEAEVGGSVEELLRKRSVGRAASEEGSPLRRRGETGGKRRRQSVETDSEREALSAVCAKTVGGAKRRRHVETGSEEETLSSRRAGTMGSRRANYEGLVVLSCPAKDCSMSFEHIEERLARKAVMRHLLKYKKKWLAGHENQDTTQTIFNCNHYTAHEAESEKRRGTREKRLASRRKYVQNNREKTLKSTRMARFKRQARNVGLTSEAEIEFFALNKEQQREARVRGTGDVQHAR